MSSTRKKVLLIEKIQKKTEEQRKRKEPDGELETLRILDVKFKPESELWEFLIQRKDHGSKSDSWEPETNLDCGTLLANMVENKVEQSVSS